MKPEEAEKRIQSVMDGVRAHRLESHTLKTKRLKFRLHDEEFEEIRETASGLGLTVPEYFCALHRYAVDHLRPDPSQGEWLHPHPAGRRNRFGGRE